MIALAIDLETTGDTPGLHGIVSIGAVCGDMCFHVKVHPHPGCQFHPEAMAKCGYDPDIWEREAVDLRMGLQLFRQYLLTLAAHHGQGLAPVFSPLAHHADFDRRFLEWAETYTACPLHLGHRWRCSLHAFRFAMEAGLVPAGSSSLDRLAHLAGLLPATGREGAHYPTEDARLCLQSWHWLLSQAHPRPSLWQRFARLFSR